jgi:DNA-binding GntR family transcriptional regulator
MAPVTTLVVTQLTLQTLAGTLEVRPLLATAATRLSAQALHNAAVEQPTNVPAG